MNGDNFYIDMSRREASPEAAHCNDKSQDSKVPVAGDIILVEADERYVGSKLWQEAPEQFVIKGLPLDATVPYIFLE